MEIDIAQRLRNVRRALERGEGRRPYAERRAKQLADSGGVGEWPRQQPFDVSALKEDWRDNPPE